MFKYILKRIGLSIIILFGVSIIVYFLVRLMPTDYIETKFSAQIQQGTLTREDIDEFKKKYGLYMPDAYVDIHKADGVLAGVTFQKDAKQDDYEDFRDELLTFEEFYAGKYSCEQENVFLELKDDGSYMIVDRNDTEAPQTLAVGLFSASADGIKMQEGTDSFISKEEYRVATLGDKFMAVLSGYLSWLGNMLRGDMGESFYYMKPVNQVISENMWISFFISLVALVLQFAIAIPMGITSATHQYSVRDYTVTVITMIGISLPSFFFAALLITVFSSWLGWFPSGGLVDASSSYVGIAHLLDMLHHLVLPMVVLVVLSIGGLMRYTRTNMLEVLNSDYIRTARSKGLSEKKVIYVHAFRNTMIPLMTLLAGILPSLFGGAMITEQVFGINGIGNLAYKALTNGDIPFIMGYNMFLAVLTVIGTLLSDLMYAVVDPRVKLSK
jgi:peptide/nickel transport system permease protein